MAERGAGEEDNVVLRAVKNYKAHDRILGLSFRTDCLFVLLNKHEIVPRNRRKLFFVYDVAGKYGFVPKAYVKDRHESPQLRNIGTAIENYVPVESTELRLTVGDIIEITDKTPKGWFNGICGDREGWFPGDFVKEDFTFEGETALTYQFTVQALNSYNTDAPGELPFSAFECFDIIKRPNTTDTYWIGRNKSGRIGKVPKDRLDERVDLPTVLLGWSWYHHDCTRSQAKVFMNRIRNVPNHYLIRPAAQVSIT